MNWKWTLIVTALAAVASSGCVNRAAQAQAKRTEQIVTDPNTPVEATPVVAQNMVQTIEITGSATTSSDTTVAAKNPGRLVAVYVQDGDSVSKGQIIALQDTSNQQIQLQTAIAGVASARSSLSQAIANSRIGPEKSTSAVLQAQAQLAQSQAALQKALNGARSEEKAQADANVASAKSTMDTAKKQRDRQRQLLDQGAISQQDFDTAENAYETAESQYQNMVSAQQISRAQTRPEDIQAARDMVAESKQALAQAQDQKKLDTLYKDQVDAAKAALQSAETQVSTARQAISDAQIRAPFAGKIDGRPAEVGTVLGSGGSVAHLVGLEGVYFEGQVSENDIQSVSAGSKVSVTLDGLPGQTFNAHVESVGQNASTFGRLFNVRVQIDGSTGAIKPGMFARGQVVVKNLANATVIPTTAILQQAGENYVFIVQAGKAHRVDVQPGLQQGNVTQVSGLTPGQQVVTVGQSGLVEGSAVKVKVPDKSVAAPVAATPSAGPKK
jgi:RND family efflux transporter MFP subunit